LTTSTPPAILCMRTNVLLYSRRFFRETATRTSPQPRNSAAERPGTAGIGGSMRPRGQERVRQAGRP